MKPVPCIHRRLLQALAALAGLVISGSFSGHSGRLAADDAADDAGATATAPAPAKASAPALAEPEMLDLETTDGVALAAWYYPVAEGERPGGVVILVHDLDGSHKTVEPLAKGLQQLGYAVVAPDLRGHGASQKMAGLKEPKADTKGLRKNDLLAIAAAEGGRVREQAALRGDLETVRRWIKRKSDAGELDINRLCVVGCGAGATLAALWTVTDSLWLPTATGPQGRQVRALALVSPAWAFKGVSLQPAIKSEVIRHDVPILVVSGTSDRDGLRLIEQFKALRPKAWFIQGPGNRQESAKDVEKKPTDATFFSVQIDTTLSADKLAADRSTNAAAVIGTFLEMAIDRDR
jgi:dienelactone hydrolase